VRGASVVNWWTGAAAAFAADFAGDRWAVLPAYLAIVAGVKSIELSYTIQALEGRPVLEALPQDEFDPTPDELARAARLLASAGAGRWTWRARAVRIRLEGGGEHDLRYTLEAAPSALPAVRSALGAYRGVELRGARRQPLPGAEVVLEMVLAGRPGSALAAAGGYGGGDPLQVFTQALGRLEPPESGSVVLDMLPATPHQQRAIRERLQHAAARLELQDLGAGADRLAAGHLARGLSLRLDPTDAIFRLQAFVLGRATEPGRALEVARELAAGFAQWTGGAHWRPARGGQLPNPWRDYRARTGLFGPWARNLATGRELSAFLRPPTGANVTRRVRRSAGALADPPRGLLDYTGAPDQIPVGAVAGRGPVAVPMADTLFSYLSARAGAGKSELMLLEAAHIALRTDHGLMLVDPHEDSMARLEAMLAGLPAARRVVRISLEDMFAPQLAWNLLAPAGTANGWKDEYRRAAALRSALAAAMGWTDRNVRILALISRASMALAELGHQLPDDLQPTVFQLESLLLDEPWREAVLPLLSPGQQRYWREGYVNVPRDVTAAVLLLADRLRSSPALMALLGQSIRSTYSVRESMDRGDIVLVCTGSGPEGSLLANLLVADLYRGARSRSDLPESERRPFWLFLDELQTIVASTGTFVSRAVEELRKFGVRLVAANQDPGRIVAGGTLAALQTNRSHVFLGANRYEAAQHMTREWEGALSPRLVASLPRRHFIASLTIAGQPSAPFELETVRVEDLFPAHDPEAVAELHREVAERTQVRDPEEVAAELETLDDRILAALGVTAEEISAEELEELPADMPAPERARILVYERGLSYRQAGRELGVSQTTVRRWIGVLDSRGYPRTRPALRVHDDQAG
jgi:Homeodomain-like domain/Type IV secretion-system coupling protein DNA-binding domain